MAKNIVINNVLNGNSGTGLQGSKKKSTAILLCLLGFFGIAGLHKFYEGKPIVGILYLLTVGFFFIGTFIDLIALMCKPKLYNA